MIEAKQIAERCKDAYSAKRYESWEQVAEELLKLGLDERAVEAIMRSKWTRWAADMTTAEYGRVPAQAITNFLRHDRVTLKQLRKLIDETDELR